MTTRAKLPIVFMVLVTGLLLAYVHEHVSIYQISYQIEAKERKLARLSEEYKTAKFAVARLRSPSTLSERMKENALELAIPTEHHVIKILKSKSLSSKIDSGINSRGSFFSWIPFMKEAQAEPSN